MKLSVIIPFYNEEQQIAHTLDVVRNVLQSYIAQPKDVGYNEDTHGATGVCCGTGAGDAGDRAHEEAGRCARSRVIRAFEMVLVDDGSTDATWEKIEQAAAQDSCIIGISFSRNFGKEAALCAGLDAVTGDAVVLLDGDLQHPPEVIPEMLELWRDGYEVVEGVKASRGKESLAHRLSAKLFYSIFYRASGFNLGDASDFKLLDRKVVEAWKALGEKDTFFRGLSCWLGFKRTQVSFDVQARETGSSKWSFLRLLKLSLHAITGFSAAPLYIIVVIGLILEVCFLVLGLQTIVNWLTGQAASGFTTVILLQLLIGGSILLSLGLIGLYLARIFVEVKDRPRYIVSRRTDGNMP